MPLVFDDEVAAPPASGGRLVFDDEQPASSGRLVFDDESAPTSIESQQTPLETGARAFAQAPGQTALSAYSGLGRAAEALVGTAEKLPGPLGTVAGGLARFYTAIPRTLGPIAGDAADRSEEVYAPDRARNPKAATVGGAIGQALPMAASAVVAGPAGPMALGAGMGADQGIRQAEEMGITDPTKKLAMGAAYAGSEMLIERMGGFGAKAFTDPLKRGAREMIKAGIKTVGSETLEEPATGIIQDAIAQGFAPASYDTTELRPFLPTRSGFPVPNDAYFTRRAYEALGGAAGGVAGAGVQAIANRSATAPVEPPAVDADPLAAFAATMTGAEQETGRRGEEGKRRGSRADELLAKRIASGLTPEEEAEFAALRPQYATPPQTTVNPFDQYDDSNVAPTTEGDLLTDFAFSQPPQSASVNPEASPVPTPEAPASAPVVPTADAGSTPATGATFEGQRETTSGPSTPPLPISSSSSAPAFGSAAPISTTRQTPVIPDAPWGARDVLDFINDNTIAVPRAILDVINQKKKAKLGKQSTGDFSWLEKYDVPKDWRKYFFSESADSTSNINEVAQDAYDEGLISDPTPDALMEGVLNSIAARESYTRDVNAREKQLAEEEKALIAREKAEAKRQQSWADDVINGSMETPFIGIDPKLMAAYTVKGAQLIKEGFTTFAKWSAEMISRFGQRVKDYLQGAWQAAVKTSQQGSIGGDPLDNRATSERMASDSGAAQNANEPSPGGLSEADGVTELWRAANEGDDTGGRFFTDSEDFAKAFAKQYGGVVRKYSTKNRRVIDLTGIKTTQEALDRLEAQGVPIDQVVPWPDYQRSGSLRDAAVFDDMQDGERLFELFDRVSAPGFWKQHGVDAIKFTENAVGRAGDTSWFLPAGVNPNLTPTGAEGRASGFKNLDTSGSTAGFLNTDIINEGVDLIRRGFTNFADWSRAMMTRFGQRLRDYLEGVWQAAMKTSERGSIGGDPLDTRATGSPMASDSGAAQNANEPSPGGLSEAEVKAMRKPGETIVYSSGGSQFASEDKTVAMAYASNPGFGGDGTIYAASVPLNKVLRDPNWREIVEDAGMDFDSVSASWDRGNYMALEEPKVQKWLQDEGYDAVAYQDDFPDGADVLYLVDSPAWEATDIDHFAQRREVIESWGSGVSGGSIRQSAVEDLIGREGIKGSQYFKAREVLQSLSNEELSSIFEASDPRIEPKIARLAVKLSDEYRGFPDDFQSTREMLGESVIEAKQNVENVLRGLDTWTDAEMAQTLEDLFADAAVDFPQKSPAAEISSSEDSEGAKTSFNGAATGRDTIPPQTPPSVNENLNPTGAEGRASGFKNLETSGTTAGFLNTEIINEGVDLIRRGFTNFADWSREMISRFGERVRDYLQGAWQAAMKNSQAGGSIPNGEKPGTGNREPGTATPNEIKLTHAAEAERMADEGQEPLPTGGQFTVEQVTAEAAERVRNGEAPALLRSLETDPRILTPLEHYMLMNYAGALESAIEQNSATLADPSTTPEARTRAAAEKSIATEERIKIAVAAQIAGSKAGAALGARSRGIARAAIPSLAEMVADITLIQDPTGKTPLPPEERAVIEQTHAKLVEATQAVEKQREEGKGGARETYNTELQKLLDEARAEIKQQAEEIEKQKAVVEEALKPRPKAITMAKNVRAKIKTAADEARERMKARGFQFSANPVFDPQFIADAAIIMADNLADGINGAIVLIREFGDAIKPFMNQIRDKAEILIRDSKKKTTTDDVLAKGRKHAAANDGKLPRSLARQLALAHIVDHIERGDKTLSAAKIADLVRADLEEFQPGITTREARDLISGYGQATFPSKDEARAELRNLAAQMQKLTQLEALRNKERLLKSGPQRDKPSAELRELQKQVEALKKELGYEARSKEDELKSARDRIKNFLENQIEELQRVLDGKARPANPREAIVYDAELNALKDLRGKLRDLVAEMPEHKLASEERRNKVAIKAAQASEAEWNRRAKAQQWTRPGKPPAAVSAAVDAARAKAKEARANFEALKKAADPRNDPEAKALRDFKRRTQKSIDDINQKIRDGAFDPPKKTPRQIKHDKESEKLRHELAMKKREWIDLKLQHRLATMGWGGKGLELVRKLYHLIRSLKAGGEFSGVLNQGMIPMVSHPILTFGSIPNMFKAFVSAQNETTIMDQIWARPNSINGRYKKHRLAINDHMDYSTLQAEGNYRSAWGNKIPFFAGTGRAYTTLLNQMRADLFDHLASKLEARKARRNETVTDSELDALAEEVNNSTGHGKLPFGLNNGNAKDLLGAFIFSPSFVMSRARYLAATSLWGGTKDSRAIIATERVRAMAGFAAIYALALALQGDDEDKLNLTEPRDSTWMKPKIGNTYLDLLAGLQQIAVLFSRLATGSTVKDGKKTDLTDPNSRSDRGDLLMKFAKTKRSPAITMADEMFLSQKDYFGEPLSRRQAALNVITPITAGSIKDLLDNEPLERAIPLSVGAFFGLRTDSRAPTR